MIQNIIPSADVLIFKDDFVLLVKHGKKAGNILGVYSPPGGRVEDGETNVQAAIRELKEETGLVAREKDLEELPLKIPDADIKRSDGTIKRYSVVVFLCRNYSGELTSNDETIPEWIAISDLKNYPLVGNAKMIVEGAFNYL